MAKAKILRRRLWAAQRGLCCYCRTPMTPSHPPSKGGIYLKTMATLEHLIRQSDGGKTTPNNCALACLECNGGRGSIDWLTYASYRQGELAA